MNLLVNEPTRRPGQPLCQDPWSWPLGGVRSRGRGPRCRRQRRGHRQTTLDPYGWTRSTRRSRPRRQLRAFRWRGLPAGYSVALLGCKTAPQTTSASRVLTDDVDQGITSGSPWTHGRPSWHGGYPHL